MAKSLKDEAPKAGHNGYDPQVAKAYLSRVEKLQADIDKIMLEAKEKCSPLRQDMADVAKEACEKLNIKRRVFGGLVSERKYARKAMSVKLQFDPEQVESLDQLRHALGGYSDLPLGQAAIAEFQDRQPKKKAV